MKVNMGCGRDIREGWMNIDLSGEPSTYFTPCDLSKGLPEGLGEIQLIHSSHFFEHLMYDDLLTLLQSCYDKLSPGGYLETSMPCFIKTAQAYLAEDFEWFKELWYVRPKSMTGYLNSSIYQYGIDGINEHKSMYSAKEFIRILEPIGFVNCKQREFDDSVDINDHVRIKYSFYVSAQKPL